MFYENHRLPCGCTNSNSTVVVQGAPDYITDERFDVHRCDTCHLVQTVISQEEFAIEKYYPKSHYGERHRFKSGVEWIHNILSSLRTRYLHEHLNSQKSLLDIGCGPGWFLHTIKKLGVKTVGTEISPEAAHHACKVLGLTVIIGDLRDLNFRGKRFDIVCIWHVLEHVFAPREFLLKVGKLQYSGGLLLVSVPDIDSTEATMGKISSWFHLDPPRHLTHFSTKSLAELLSDGGYEIIQKSRFVPEYDFFSFVQTALNRIGLRHNLLYILIRSKKLSPSNNKLKLFGELLPLLILTPLLSALSLIVVPIWVLQNKSGTITYLARKK